ncbi:glycoside hydrolase family 43 protein [Arthrobacter sp. SA17]
MTEKLIIQNPIIPGFSPDPSIVRVGEDYYIATSTFEWMPGVQLHHSLDLVNWDLIGYALHDLDLRGVAASGGVWAPDLSHCTISGEFHLVYSITRSTTAGAFDVSNYVITSTDILGPWSEPSYLNSVGFDASLFHDDDGRSWLVTLEWDTRKGYEHPGWIILEEYDRSTKSLIGAARRISRGGTDMGCLEAPHLYKRDDRYYLMTAEGGTGFGHGVVLSRSDNIDGPYEADPGSPFITNAPHRYFGRNWMDFLKPSLFNPQSELQKSGHGCLVETGAGEWFVAHLCSRPLSDSRRSVLGRETAIQQVNWVDGWLRLAGGGNQAQLTTSAPAAATVRHTPDLNVRDDFDNVSLDPRISSVRHPVSTEWASLSARPGHLRLFGGDSLFSTFDTRLLAVRLQSFHATAETRIDFEPTHYAQSAGLTVYYDNRNFFYLRVYWSEGLGRRAIAVFTGRDGEKDELLTSRVPAPDGALFLRAEIADGQIQFAYRSESENWKRIGPSLDGTVLSDDVLHGFTGTMVGVTAQDGFRRQGFADFDYFSLNYPMI